MDISVYFLIRDPKRMDVIITTCVMLFSFNISSSNRLQFSNPLITQKNFQKEINVSSLATYQMTTLTSDFIAQGVSLQHLLTSLPQLHHENRSILFLRSRLQKCL
jgi:hypothetical protein